MILVNTSVEIVTFCYFLVFTYYVSRLILSINLLNY